MKELPKLPQISELDLEFPRSMRTLHQFELSSRCDLKCVYCPNRDIARGKYPNRTAMDMEWSVFERALEWVAHYVKAGTQHEINLAGIGESTLHPRFVEMIARAREVVGPDIEVTFTTNGLNMAKDPTLVERLKPYNVTVYVSLHRPEKAGPAVQQLIRAKMLRDVSADPSVFPNSWAGQVEWTDVVERGTFDCTWLRGGRAMVMADGRITTCCLDASGTDGIVGHVNDEIGSIVLKPYSLCKANAATGKEVCYQSIGSVHWDQEKGEPK